MIGGIFDLTPLQGVLEVVIFMSIRNQYSVLFAKITDILIH